MSAGSRTRGIVRLAVYATPLCVVALTGFRYFGDAPGSPSREFGSVQIVGSETIRPIVSACAEEFMTRNPQADIVVKGGGSGDGIAALLHGIVDLGMTSRELSAREREYAAAKGIEISLFDIALDGITIIVNRANATTALDLEQLRDLFTGKTRNWRELGGAAGDVSVLGRTAGSGTALLFAERVLRGAPYARTAQHLPTNEAIVAEVSARPGAIGYSSLGALRGAGDRVTVVALRARPQAPPVAPTAEAVRSRTYPLARTLYLSAAGTPTGTVKAFLDYCSSATGQALLQKAGYIGIHPVTQ